MQQFPLVNVEVLGGLRSFGAGPGTLTLALFIETGLSSGNSRLEALNKWLGYGEPGQMRVVLRIPGSLAKDKLSINIRSEFPPILYPEDEGAMYDFQHGRWGDEGQRLVDWIKSSYQSVILPALSLLTDGHRHLELESGADGIRAKAVSGP